MCNATKTLAAVMFCTALMLFIGTPVQAQWNWGFGGGGTSHHHHDAFGHRVDDAGHHIDNHGHHTGSWGVYDSPSYNQNYYTPSYSQPSYSQPSYSQRTTSNYRGTTNVIPRAQFSGAPIRIRNPRETGGSLHYDLDQHHYDMNPGESQTFGYTRDWVIRFDRGDGRGQAQYRLSPGEYSFTVTSRGWDLVKEASAVSASSQFPSPPPAIGN